MTARHPGRCATLSRGASVSRRAEWRSRRPLGPARHVAATLRAVGDLLLVVLSAPLGHQCVQRVPVPHWSGFRAKRGSAPEGGEPIVLSHGAYCFSSRGEIATCPSCAGRIVTVAPLPPPLHLRSQLLRDTARARARSWRASPAPPGSTRRCRRPVGCLASHGCQCRPRPNRR